MTLTLDACRALKGLGYEGTWPQLVWCRYERPERWEQEWWDDAGDAWRDGTRGTPVALPYYACPDSVVALDWLEKAAGGWWSKADPAAYGYGWTVNPMYDRTQWYTTPSELICASRSASGPPSRRTGLGGGDDSQPEMLA